MMNFSVRYFFNVYERKLQFQLFVTVSRFCTMGESSGQSTLDFSVFPITSQAVFVCLLLSLNFKREKKERETKKGCFKNDYKEFIYSCCNAPQH